MNILSICIFDVKCICKWTFFVAVNKILTVYLTLEAPSFFFPFLVMQISRVTNPKIDLLVCLKYIE